MVLSPNDGNTSLEYRKASCQLQPHPPLYLHFSIAATGISKGVCHFDVTSGPVKCYMVLLCGTEVNGNPLGLDYLHPDGAVYR